MEIKLSDKFKKQLKKIKEKTTVFRIKESIKQILRNPEIGKPLRYDLKGFRSLRIDKSRLIYVISGDTIIIMNLNHRKNVYKN